MARRAHASARWCPLDAMRLGTTRAHGTQLRGFAHPTLNLQELRRVAAKYLALVIRMQVQVLDYGNARALEHLERRSVGAENEAIGADGFERAARRGHVKLRSPDLRLARSASANPRRTARPRPVD